MKSFAWGKDDANLLEGHEFGTFIFVPSLVDPGAVAILPLKREDAVARFSVANEKGWGIVTLGRLSGSGLLEEIEDDMSFPKGLSAVVFLEWMSLSALPTCLWTGFEPCDDLFLHSAFVVLLLRGAWS